MCPFTVSRMQAVPFVDVQVYFLDCPEPIYNVFNDPELAEALGRELIIGAVELNAGIMLHDPRGYRFAQSQTLPALFWITHNNQLPDILPNTYPVAEEAFALGITLMEMAYAMRVQAAETEALARIAV